MARSRLGPEFQRDLGNKLGSNAMSLPTSRHIRVATEIFECKRCGTCCRKLIKTDSDGYTLGLALIGDETALFSQDVVSPHFAVGLAEPSTIVSRQLNVSVCPHISGQNHCEVYERRPLACRVFPYSITASGAKAWPDCTKGLDV
jgi:Fe-S-cluster containining protein